MSTPLQPGLFDDEPNLAPPPPPVVAAPTLGVTRVLMPNRTQLELRPCDLEALLPAGHRARLVWGWVMRADLSGMYALIRAVEGGSGRTPIAPEILFALWLYATLEGVGSARAVARLTREHDAYRWICGGVQVNYHTLADFRTAHGEALDALLTDSVAALLTVGAVTLKRAAREREEGIEEALQRWPQMAEIKTKQGKKAEAARVSTTDAAATVMKMADGGYRPAYNGQFVSDTASQVIVGVEAATAGTDMAQLTPMIEPVSNRYGQHPAEWLVDGGYPAHEQLEQAAASTIVDAPVPKPKDADTDPHLAKAGDSEAVAAWRERMGTDDAKDIYQERAATAECVNAQARERGLTRLRVRGTPKVRCVLLLHALAHNLMRTLALAPELLGHGTGASATSAMAT